jgi:dTDP-3-amino-3,6-dideoxy-alpha-D-glucopyranose N,N-dimethyltransferase
MFGQTAHIYDLIYEAAGKDYAAEAADIRDQIVQRAENARSLLDVACGTGGHLRHFADWFDVSGLDLDPTMLAVARANVPAVPLVEGDMRSFHLGQSFDAVVCLFSSVGYMASTDELDRAVEHMAGHLAPEGVLIVDGWVRPDAWIEGGSVHALCANREGTAVARVTKTRREGAKTILDMHHLVATSEGIEHLVDRHEMTLFTGGEYERAFERAGLACERLDSPMPGRDRYIAMKDR